MRAGAQLKLTNMLTKLLMLLIIGKCLKCELVKINFNKAAWKGIVLNDTRIQPSSSYRGFAQVPPAAGYPSLPLHSFSSLDSIIQSALLPPGFVCIPIGTCNPANGLVIGATTPNNIPLCPPGETPCSGKAGGNQCGLRFVNSINPADGDATPGSYPWQAYIVNQTGFIGGGVLLDEYHILTAAHKVFQDTGNAITIGVYLGVNNSTQLGVRYDVDRIFLHPNFNPANLFNDLALIRLMKPIIPATQMYINAACLPQQGQSFVGQTCWVSGWGKPAFASHETPTYKQKQVQVPIVPSDVCYASMSSLQLLGSNVNKYLDPFGEICAGGETAKDACTQDGGSPMVCNFNGKFTIAGIVIWGKGCGQQGVYGVYVNVAYYATWITDTISLLNSVS